MGRQFSFGSASLLSVAAAFFASAIYGAAAPFPRASLTSSGSCSFTTGAVSFGAAAAGSLDTTLGLSPGATSVLAAFSFFYLTGLAFSTGSVASWLFLTLVGAGSASGTALAASSIPILFSYLAIYSSSRSPLMPLEAPDEVAQ